MKIKTSELQGAALDWVVAGLEKMPQIVIETRPMSYTFRPSTDWGIGGPIIDRELIQSEPAWKNAGYEESGRWYWQAALVDEDDRASFVDGPTLLIAAMRCYVAAKLGDEVEVPDELGRA